MSDSIASSVFLPCGSKCHVTGVVALWEQFKAQVTDTDLKEVVLDKISSGCVGVYSLQKQKRIAASQEVLTYCHGKFMQVGF